MLEEVWAHKGVAGVVQGSRRILQNRSGVEKRLSKASEAKGSQIRLKPSSTRLSAHEYSSSEFGEGRQRSREVGFDGG